MAHFTHKPGQSSGSGGSGETNTGANQGTGAGVFKDKSGPQLRFKSLKAGSNVTITPSADEIEVAASGGTATTDASQLTSGILPDARIQASAVSQHQGAITVAQSQVTGLAAALTGKADASHTHPADPQIATNTTAIAAKADQSSVDSLSGTVAGHTAAIAAKQDAYGLTTVAASGPTQTIDWSANAAFKVTLTANCTFTLSNPVAGMTYILQLVQDGTGSRIITLPSAVKHQGGTAPTLTTDAGAVDVLTLFWDGGQYLANIGKDYK